MFAQKSYVTTLFMAICIMGLRASQLLMMDLRKHVFDVKGKTEFMQILHLLRIPLLESRIR